MRLRPAFLAALALLCVAPAVQAERAVPPAAQTPPDPEHAGLARLAGDWTVTQTLWSAANAAPRHDRGRARLLWVLQGRHLQQTLRIDGPGKPFEGLSYLGYDNASGRYFSTWMDVNFPGLILAQGVYDPAQRTYVFTGSMAADANGQTVPVREVLRIIDADHFTYEFFETRAGRETLGVRLEYARA